MSPGCVNWNYEPSITLATALDGRTFVVGTTAEVAWHSTHVDAISIQLSRDGGLTWEVIVPAMATPPRSYVWTVTGPGSGLCVLRVVDTAGRASAQSGFFAVAARPAITRAPEALTFLAVEGGAAPPPQTLSISNPGDVPLDWSTVGSAAWLRLSPTSGTCTGETDEVMVEVDVAGLADGAYGATITIAGVGATNTPQTVDVTFTVRSRPEISLDRMTVAFTAVEGEGNPADELVTVTDANTGANPIALVWAAAEAPDETWLTLTNTSGAGGGAVTLSAATGSLVAGTYSATVEISDPNASNTPQTVAVTFTVRSRPEISLNRTTLTFIVEEGKPDPPPQQVTVTDANTDVNPIPLAWTAVESPDRPWLALTGSTGGDGDPLTVAATTGALLAGTYGAAIEVSDPNASNSPQPVVVELEVVRDPSRWYVDADAPAGGNGLSWATAFRHPQDAADVATAGHEVWVAEGTYKDHDADRVVLDMTDGVAVYGGFAGTEALLAERDPAVNVTVLNGDLDGDGLGDAYHVVVGASDARLDGFTVTRGLAREPGPVDDRGAGMYNVSLVNLAIVNCRFNRNNAQFGAGMYNFASSPDITGCTFSNGRAGSGAGVYNAASSPSVSDSYFYANEVWFFGGGGMYNDASSPILTACTFDSNATIGAAGPSGAGIYNDNSSASIIDCVFIGNSTSDFSGMGGAVVNYNGGTPTISGSTFTLNSAAGGAAIGIGSVTVAVVSNCSFDRNSATLGGGGAIFTSSDSLISDCDFYDNSAEAGGGAIAVSNGSSTIRDCTFANNHQDSGSGGAVCIYRSSAFATTVDVDGCVFEGNSAWHCGGGIFIRETDAVSIADCAFIGNNSRLDGGGVYVENSASCQIRSSSFFGNTAGSWDGGAITVRGDATPIESCVFSGNTTDLEGGAIWGNDATTITNCTISRNSAFWGGGVGGEAHIANCVLWMNEAVHGPDVWSVAPVDILHSNVSQDGFAGVGGNISEDPRFFDADGPDDLVGTADDDLHLWGASPCIDAADGDLAPEFDMDGRARYDDPAVEPNTGVGLVTYADMGAYEYYTDTQAPVAHPQSVAVDEESSVGITLAASDPQSDPLSWSILSQPIHGTLTGTAPDLVYAPDPDFSGEDTFEFRVSDATYDSNVAMVRIDVQAILDVWYVDGAIAVPGDGRSWGNAFSHPQDGVDAAWPGDQVWVAEGSYVRRVVDDDHVLAMKRGVEIYGGFGGTEIAVDQRDPGLHVIVLDGDSDGDGTGDTRHVVLGVSDAVLDGFTVCNGYYDGGAGTVIGAGAGMYNRASRNLTVGNCIFADNVATSSGGGAMSNIHDSVVEVHDCVFVRNSSSGGGGGLGHSWGSLRVLRTSFVSNAARKEGGGIYGYGDFELTNCTFSGNTAADGGGIALSSIGTIWVTNCTLSGNSASDQGGGMAVGGSPVITNCVMWGNVAPEGPQFYDTGFGTPVVQYCDIGQPGYAGTNGNIDVDPLFFDPGHWDDGGTPGDTSDDVWIDGDYHLQSEYGRWNPATGVWEFDSFTSPCIDAGDPASAYSGEPAPNGSRVNMGAYGNTPEASKSAP